MWGSDSSYLFEGMQGFGERQAKCTDKETHMYVRGVGIFAFKQQLWDENIVITFGLVKNHVKGRLQ